MRQGKAYPCFATREELDARSRAAEGGRRAARLLRRVGDLAGRAGRAGAGAARRGRPVRGPLPVPGHRRPPGQLHRRDPRRDQLRRQPQRRGHPEEQRPAAAAAHVPLRARRRRSPDAGHAGDPRRGVALLGAAAPPAVRRARLPPDPLRARGAADEAGRRQPPQAVQAQGPRSQRRLLHRTGLSRPRRCSTTCAAWPTGGWPRCRCPRRSPRRSGCPSAASPGRCSTWSSWTTSAPTTSPPCPARRSSSGYCRGRTRTTRNWRRCCAPSRDLALRALAVEREDTDKPRKDLRKWADFRPVYGFFFPEIFELVTDPADERFGGLTADLVRALASGFAAGYVAPGPDVGVVRPDPRARRPARLRAEAEGLQEEPGGLPRLDPRRGGGHPGADHRVPPEPGPGSGRRCAGPRRGAAPGQRADLTLRTAPGAGGGRESGGSVTGDLRRVGSSRKRSPSGTTAHKKHGS